MTRTHWLQTQIPTIFLFLFEVILFLLLLCSPESSLKYSKNEVCFCSTDNINITTLLHATFVLYSALRLLPRQLLIFYLLCPPPAHTRTHTHTHTHVHTAAALGPQCPPGQGGEVNRWHHGLEEDQPGHQPTVGLPFDLSAHVHHWLTWVILFLKRLVFSSEHEVVIIVIKNIDSNKFTCQVEKNILDQMLNDCINHCLRHPPSLLPQCVVLSILPNQFSWNV